MHPLVKAMKASAERTKAREAYRGPACKVCGRPVEVEGRPDPSLAYFCAGCNQELNRRDEEL